MALLLAGLSLCIMYAVLIKFYEHWWRRLPEFEGKNEGVAMISVIIAARNEEGNLPALLTCLDKQLYSKEHFEVIIVDDDSSDRTADIAAASLMPNLQLTHSQGGSKKMAIDAGIRIAKGELVVTTDADCLPPPGWLSTMADFYQTHHSAFIAAPVSYLPRKGLLNYFQTLDFVILQGITAASVAAGFHSMCNGANLAYKRSAFFQVNGFSGIDHIASGDDMLLMHKISKEFPRQVHYLRSREAIVQTAPAGSWKEFFWQRMRWSSKSSHYGDKKIFLTLLLVYVFNLIFIVLAIAGFWNQAHWSTAVILWIAKSAIELPFVHAVARFYGQQYLVPWFFLMQPLHILYTVVVGLLSQFTGYYWKGRRLK